MKITRSVNADRERVLMIRNEPVPKNGLVATHQRRVTGIYTDL